MPDDGDTRYDPQTKRWLQFNDPPGRWKPVRPDFGELDRPIDEVGDLGLTEPDDDR